MFYHIRTSRWRQTWVVIVLGIASCAALWSTGVGKSGFWATAFVRGYILAWVFYAAGAIIVTRAQTLSSRMLFIIVVAALGMRVIALARSPSPSTDFWRYLWDGRCINAGINPYRYSPNAPQLRFLRDKNWQWINFRDIRTVYPPSAELLFAALGRVRSRDAELFKWAFLVFDMGSILVLIALLRLTGRKVERVIWYAWCPLTVTEATAGAHIDAFGLFLLLLAFLFTARRNGWAGLASALALASAVLAKGFAILMIPFFLRKSGWKTWLIFAVACLFLVAPFASAGQLLFSGLREYLGNWATNSSLFYLCNWTLEKYRIENHYTITRIASTIAVALVVIYLLRRQRPGMEGLLSATFSVMAAYLLLSGPTLPWYVIWTVPALCWWAIPGWVLFTLTVSAQYYARWLYPDAFALLMWIGYVPVYALLIGQVIYGRAWARNQMLKS